MDQDHGRVMSDPRDKEGITFVVPQRAREGRGVPCSSTRERSSQTYDERNGVRRRKLVRGKSRDK